MGKRNNSVTSWQLVVAVALISLSWVVGFRPFKHTDTASTHVAWAPQHSAWGSPRRQLAKERGCEGGSGFPPGGLTLHCLLSQWDTATFEHEAGEAKSDFCTCTECVFMFIYLLVYIEIYVRICPLADLMGQEQWKYLIFKRTRNLRRLLCCLTGKSKENLLFLAQDFGFIHV